METSILNVRNSENKVKISIETFAKSISTAISLAPELKRFLDDYESLKLLGQKPKSNTLLAGSILSSAIFISSAFLFSLNESVGIIGMISSIAVMSLFAKFKER